MLDKVIKSTGLLTQLLSLDIFQFERICGYDVAMISEPWRSWRIRLQRKGGSMSGIPSAPWHRGQLRTGAGSWRPRIDARPLLGIRPLCHFLENKDYFDFRGQHGGWCSFFRTQLLYKEKLSMFVRLIGGAAAQSSGQQMLNNVNQTHLVLASGKFGHTKKIVAILWRVLQPSGPRRFLRERK